MARAEQINSTQGTTTLQAQPWLFPEALRARCLEVLVQPLKSPRAPPGPYRIADPTLLGAQGRVCKLQREVHTQGRGGASTGRGGGGERSWSRARPPRDNSYPPVASARPPAPLKSPRCQQLRKHPETLARLSWRSGQRAAVGRVTGVVFHSLTLTIPECLLLWPRCGKRASRVTPCALGVQGRLGVRTGQSKEKVEPSYRRPSSG